ncbi:MAG TPA: hypothetical protein PLQ15_06440 [Syntrophales bacterium]|nr:hypothetical protein [Syntrophobacterales bacterium]HQL90223.1 hypothetical protein [Syntrophales bacterium]
MKRILIGSLLTVFVLSGVHGAVQAQERKQPDLGGGHVAVLDRGTFVEVRDRGPGQRSVILYEVVKGKIQVVDAVSVSSDFTKDPPVIRYTRIKDIKEQ